MPKTKSNFTRGDLFNKIRLEYPTDGKPNNTEYPNMSETCFYLLIGVQKETASPKLAKEVKKLSEDFSYEVKKKWNLSKINRHLDRFRRYSSDFLNQRFVLEHLYPDQVEAAPEEKKAEEVSEPLPGPSKPIPTPQPVEEVPFLEKV